MMTKEEMQQIIDDVMELTNDSEEISARHLTMLEYVRTEEGSLDHRQYQERKATFRAI